MPKARLPKKGEEPMEGLEETLANFCLNQSISPKVENANLETNSVVPEIQKEHLNQSNFVAPIRLTKLEAAKRIASILRRARTDYTGSKAIIKEARRIAGLKPKHKPKKQPRLLTEDEFKRFFSEVDKQGNLQHQLMIRILFYTGARVSELTRIKRTDIDLDNCSIRIEQGKGSKDRKTLFPESLKLALSAYLQATEGSTYLFESRHCHKYTSRRIQQVIAAYAEKAGLAGRVHPHLLRHHCLTELTRQHLSDAQIQLLSGHASKSSLEVYQHLSLASVSDDYQRAMAGKVP